MPGTPRPSIRIYVFDVDNRPIRDAKVEAVPFRFPRLRRTGPRLLARICRFLCGLFGRPPCDCAKALARSGDWGVFTAPLDVGMYTLRVSAAGLEPQTRDVRVTRRGLRAVFVLAPPGTPFYYRGRTKVPYRATGLYAIALAPGYYDQTLRDLAAASGVDIASVSPEDKTPDEKFAHTHGVRIYSANDGALFERLARSVKGVTHVGAVVAESTIDKERSVSFLTEEFVFRLRPNAEIPAMVRSSGYELREHGRARLWVVRAPAQDSIALLDLCNRVAALADDVTSGVMWAEPNLYSTRVIRGGVAGFSNFMTFVTQQPHHVLLRTPDVWNGGVKGAGAVVAILDDGCDMTHPCFPPGKIADFYDFRAQQQLLPTENHGTACASLAAGAFEYGNNYAGVAPAAQLLVAATGGTDMEYADGFRWCAQLSTFAPIPPAAAKADVVSCSWALRTVQPAGSVKVALDDLFANNVVVLFASGNHGDTFANLSTAGMAAYPMNIAVGSSSTLLDTSVVPPIAPALASEDRVPESDYGPELDVVAPGGSENAARYGDTMSAAPLKASAPGVAQ